MNFRGFAVTLLAWSILMESCKLGNSRSIGRVIGGFNSIPGEFPYQVSLQVYDEYEKSWVPICGGSILNPTTILSAAHCVLDGPIDGPFRIVAGEHNLNLDEGTEQHRTIDRIVIHDDWDDFTYQNDVAVFFISQSHPLEFNSYVQAIQLPPQDHISTGLGTVTGWGADGENAPRNILQKLEVPIYNRGRCEAVYGDDFTESMICAGNPNGGQDACAGDSGGPLRANDLDYEYVSGIVSWGVGCGRPGYLGVYTQVSSFTNWIKYVIKHYQPTRSNKTVK